MARPNEKDIANVNVVSASTPNVLTDSIYNMTPNVEELSEQSTSKADDSNKATLASTVSSSAVILDSILESFILLLNLYQN